MSDFPDWFGQPQFPRYGGAREAQNTLIVPASSTVSILSITGQGQIYSIELQIRNYLSAKNDKIYLYIDGSEVITIEPTDVYSQGKRQPLTGDWYITRYDVVATSFFMFYAGPISFASSVELKYEERSDNTPEVAPRIRYALIE